MKIASFFHSLVNKAGGACFAISVIFNFQNFWVLLSYSMGGMMLQLLKLKRDGLVGNGFKVYI